MCAGGWAHGSESMRLDSRWPISASSCHEPKGRRSKHWRKNLDGEMSQFPGQFIAGFASTQETFGISNLTHQLLQSDEALVRSRLLLQ
jgi:hypothetical protein